MTYEEKEREIEAKENGLTRRPIESYIRPGSVIVMLSFFIFLTLADGNLGNFTVKEPYIDVLEIVLITIIASFFGGRSFEKLSRINKYSIEKKD